MGMRLPIIEYESMVKRIAISVSHLASGWTPDVEAITQAGWIGAIIGMRAYERRLLDPRGTGASERTYVYRNARLYAMRELRSQKPHAIADNRLLEGRSVVDELDDLGFDDCDIGIL